MLLFSLADKFAESGILTSNASNGLTVAVSIYYLAPVLVALYGLLFLGQTGTRAVILDILLAFLGAAVVSGITIEDILMLNILDASYAFCVAVLYAGLILLSKRVNRLIRQ